VLTCAGAAGNRCTANSSAGEFDIGFDGGIAARIEDLAGADGKNGCVGHGEFEMRPSKNQFDTGLASTIAIRGAPRRLIQRTGGFSVYETNHLKSV
jgi:hypothetical protein